MVKITISKTDNFVLRKVENTRNSIHISHTSPSQPSMFMNKKKTLFCIWEKNCSIADAALPMAAYLSEETKLTLRHLFRDITTLEIVHCFLSMPTVVFFLFFTPCWEYELKSQLHCVFRMSSFVNGGEYCFLNKIAMVLFKSVKLKKSKFYVVVTSIS